MRALEKDFDSVNARLGELGGPARSFRARDLDAVGLRISAAGRDVTRFESRVTVVYVDNLPTLLFEGLAQDESDRFFIVCDQGSRQQQPSRRFARRGPRQ